MPLTLRLCGCGLLGLLLLTGALYGQRDITPTVRYVTAFSYHAAAGVIPNT